jgi:outer membrane protein assembly factor BamB
VAVGVVVTAAIVIVAPASAAWTQYRGDAERRGSADWGSAQAPRGVVAWRAYVAANAMIDASPVVGPDGTIYLGARRGSTSLLAFGADGRERWASTLGGYQVHATPAVRDDGSLVVVGSRRTDAHDHRTINTDVKDIRERVFLVASTSGRISDQSPEWRAAEHRSPLLDAQGNIYFSFGNGLYRFNRGGSLRHAHKLLDVTGDIQGYWPETCPPACLSAPSAGAPAVRYLKPSPAYSRYGEIVGSGYAHSYRFSPSTYRGWRRELGAVTTAALGSAGRIYIGDSGKALTAYDRSGGRLWRVKLNGIPIAPPALGRDRQRQDNVYAVTGRDDATGNQDVNFRSGSLYAFDQEGHKRWQRNFAGQLGAPAVARIGDTELIVVASGGAGALNLLTAFRDDGSLAWMLTLDAPALGSPAVANDAIYVATKRSLYAVR